MNAFISLAMSKDVKMIVQNTILAGLDHEIEIMRSARDSVRTPSGGWLKAIRQSLGFSAAQVAAKMGIKRQPYYEIEKREVAQSVSLKILGAAADALDCDLVCFLVPKKHQATTFVELAQRLSPDYQAKEAVDHTMKLEAQDNYIIPKSGKPSSKL